MTEITEEQLNTTNTNLNYIGYQLYHLAEVMEIIYAEEIKQYKDEKALKEARG
ncbi:MAG: hypothetical protein KAT65_23230 [Methanophagales archaeon]|nr:hypothetical protein [Methanophagales archaeon]